MLTEKSSIRGGSYPDVVPLRADGFQSKVEGLVDFDTGCFVRAAHVDSAVAVGGG